MNMHPDAPLAPHINAPVSGKCGTITAKQPPTQGPYDHADEVDTVTSPNYTPHSSQSQCTNVTFNQFQQFQTESESQISQCDTQASPAARNPSNCTLVSNNSSASSNCTPQNQNQNSDSVHAYYLKEVEDYNYVKDVFFNYLPKKSGWPERFTFPENLSKLSDKDICNGVLFESTDSQEPARIEFSAQKSSKQRKQSAQAWVRFYNCSNKLIVEVKEFLNNHACRVTKMDWHIKEENWTGFLEYMIQLMKLPGIESGNSESCSQMLQENIDEFKDLVKKNYFGLVGLLRYTHERQKTREAQEKTAKANEEICFQDSMYPIDCSIKHNIFCDMPDHIVQDIIDNDDAAKNFIVWYEETGKWAIKVSGNPCLEQQIDVPNAQETTEKEIPNADTTPSTSSSNSSTMVTFKVHPVQTTRVMYKVVKEEPQKVDNWKSKKRPNTRSSHFDKRTNNSGFQ